jgi:segregation and condensation protein B
MTTDPGETMREPVAVGPGRPIDDGAPAVPITFQGAGVADDGSIDDGTAADAADDGDVDDALDRLAGSRPGPGAAGLSVEDLEALLFIAERPLSRREIATVAGVDADTVDGALGDLEVALRDRGIRLVASGERVQLVTAPSAGSLIARYIGAEGQRLSPAALETLAIVAYRQPITAPEISEIRGVNSNQTIRTLLERRMIRVAGRKNVVGSPFLYRTTREFLVHFGLNDIRDMPRLEEFGDLIGEQINEELVLAIESTPIAEGVEVPLAQGEQIDDEVNAELSAIDEKVAAENVAAENAPREDDAQPAMNEVQSGVVNDQSE